MWYVCVLLKEVRIRVVMGGAAKVTGVRWIPGTRDVLQSSEDKTPRIWDTRTCAPSVTFPRQNYIHVSADFHVWGKKKKRRWVHFFTHE
jgi:hypothetical protein